MRRKDISFAIEHQCPQCGAPITLEEDTRFFVCEFCRVRSVIFQKDFFRYFLSPSTDIPIDQDLFYLPYWRFKGVRYLCTPGGIQPRFIDVSSLAMEGVPSNIPFSLGFRSQVLPLKLITPQTKGRFARPQPSRVVLMKHQGQQQPTDFKEDIGEALSLIYAPFYIRQKEIVDGVLNQPLPGDPSHELDPAGLTSCRPYAETSFISGLCPSCGWDLEGQSDSITLICRNCHSLWRAKGHQLHRIRYGAVPPDRDEDIMVPFWKIRAGISPMVLSTYADLVRQANLPRAVLSRWENQPLYFWSPAFKIQPKLFLRLLTQMAIVQPEPDLVTSISSNIHLPVNLPPTEAVQTIRITMAAMIRPITDILQVLPVTDVTPESISLVFIPFESRHHEIFHPGLNVAIHKNVLKLSGNL